MIFSKIINNNAKRLLNFYGKTTLRNYSINNTIIISGTPRGGTTWLAELLAAVTKSPILWEPLEPSYHQEIKEKFGWDYYVPYNYDINTDTSHKEIYTYLESVLSGNIPLAKYL